MDIFLRNIPTQSTDGQLRAFFKPVLQVFGIHTFNVDKFYNKPNGHLTIFDTVAGSEFLRVHGSPTGQAASSPPRPLIFLGRTIFCSRDRNPPDPFMVRSLARQEAKRLRAATRALNAPPVPRQAPQTHWFGFEVLWNGLWDYEDGRLAFFPTYRDHRRGSVGFGNSTVVISLTAELPATTRVEIPYRTIESVIIAGGGGGGEVASITFTLSQTPSIVRVRDVTDILANLLRTQNLLAMISKPERTNELVRICNLHPNHDPSLSFVYRLQLSSQALPGIEKVLKSISMRGGPRAQRQSPPASPVLRDIASEFGYLCDALRDMQLFGTIPFSIKFQLQRLAQNGFLAPRKVIEIATQIRPLVQDYASEAVAEALRKLLDHSEYPGPGVDPDLFTVRALIDKIKSRTTSFLKGGSIYDHARRHEHLGIVHRVVVTPSCVFLEGPELETKNRVLRKYSSHLDYFVRVTFSDEDGLPVRRQSQMDLSCIFHEKFKSKLDNSITVAGRLFKFLGFSHSSLRCQQSWYMAPFVQNGELVHAQEVIKRLGDFSLFRSPAKCAARIGQAFSDATQAIPMPLEALQFIPDIQRNGRVFSDGVGTISQESLKKVWAEFSRSRKSHPTVLQIRFQGAKGVLALDSRLEGEKFCIRPSMTKFKGSDAVNLEITGAAFKPLPMFLNQSLVKILEDLGVDAEALLSLQKLAVEELKDLSASPINAATYLERKMIGISSRTPALIRHLHAIGLDFRHDMFLEQFVEMAALISLRDMKHKARIPVYNARTLYGIMDETGYLKEGEIHVVTKDQNGQIEVLVGGSVAITRSPARHPGDVQVVKAVEVPDDSPLTHLHNCVIFSQHGSRDLASQLSGGDLDGDLFNVIFEPSLLPKRTVRAADYPRVNPVDIGRTVKTSDMTDFFVTFMETDQLGHICNTHMQVADQMSEGTEDMQCIQLAEMASTAVDFSKTGVAVEIALMPKDYRKRFKPDFMANGPRLILGQNLVLLEDLDEEDDVDVFEQSDIDPKPPRTLYYETDKVLGRLYRAIDETKFLAEMQSLHGQAGQTRADGVSRPLMSQVWDYVQRETRLVEYTHLLGAAQEIRAAYEDGILDLMYSFSPQPKKPLTELEVFTGTILGKDGAMPSKGVRESAHDLKDRFNTDVAFYVQWIETGYAEDNDPSLVGSRAEALERSIACLDIAVNQPGLHVRRVGEIKSFVYIAAAVCLQELERFQGQGMLRLV